MLVPLSWLKEYVDISDISLEELRKKMSASGLAVERQHTVGEGIEHIVIGEITRQERHPDSDHLWVCQVSIGTESVQIVTGAANIFEGAKVPVILPGNVLPNGTKIEVTKLRGYDSHGMMCSERELELADSHEGIMILGVDAVVGSRLVEYLGLPDIVFDVEITANRGDLNSVVGIAREVATLFGKELKMPVTLALGSTGKSDTIPTISVSVEDPAACPRFSVIGFDGFTLGTSPMWMQQRLLRAGMRPINNLVDITNYVMLELGQPSHAYDALQVKDRTFVVRNAHKGEPLQTLDEKSYALDESIVVIADPEKVLGLAGIMGGNASKITAETRALLLEVANFDPVRIRRTGMKLNIRSEAIVRFERGIDVEGVPFTLSRLNHLLHEYAQARLVTPLVEVYTASAENNPVTLTSRLLQVYLGESMPCADAERILNSLGFATLSREGNDVEWRLTVSVPSWRRRDVSIEEDLIEEVTRIYGYDNVRIATPVGQIPFVPTNKKLVVKKVALDALKGLGFQEVLTYSFNSREQIEMSGYAIENALEMANPLSEEQRYLRLSLLPNLLWVAEKNKHLRQDLHLFELSSVYHRNVYDILPDEAVSLAFEPLYVSGIVAPVQYDFESAFGCVQATLRVLFSTLRITGVSFVQDAEKLQKLPAFGMFHPGRVGGISLDGENVIGLYGEIHPQLQEKLGLKQSSFMFDLAFSPLVEKAQLTVSYQPYSVYPETTEAMSFIMDESQSVGTMVASARNLDARIVKVEVGKPYHGDQIESGKKAVTFTFVYQSTEGPIKEKDAEQIRNMITEHMSTNYSAVLRS